jgi:hypothetical protein
MVTDSQAASFTGKTESMKSHALSFFRAEDETAMACE